MKLGRVLVEILEGLKLFILLLLLGVIAGGIHGCSVGRWAESKQKGQTRSIRMEDFLSWGQFFT